MNPNIDLPTYSYSASKEDDDPILEFQNIPIDKIQNKKIEIAAVPFYVATGNELISLTMRQIETIRKKGATHGPQHILPINPYHFFNIRHFKRYRQLSQSSFINLPSEKGMLGISALFHKDLPEIISVTQFVLNIIRVAQAKEYTLFIVGSSNRVLDTLNINFMRSFPRLRITGKHNGQLKGKAAKNVIEALRKTDPHIILLSLGYKKELKWIEAHKSELKNCILINLDGALDIMAGKKKSAPDFVVEKHLAWLWVLFSKPFNWYKIPYVLYSYIELVFLKIFLRKKYVTETGN